MLHSLGGKLTASAVCVFAVIIIIISAFNFQKTSSDVKGLFIGESKSKR